MTEVCQGCEKDLKSFLSMKKGALYIQTNTRRHLNISKYSFIKY